VCYEYKEADAHLSVAYMRVKRCLPMHDYLPCVHSDMTLIPDSLSHSDLRSGRNYWPFSGESVVALQQVLDQPFKVTYNLTR